MYMVKHCARKDAPIRSPTGIGAGLGGHLAPMVRPDKIPIGDRSGFGAWFANRSIRYSGAMAQAIEQKSVVTSAKVLWHQNCYGTTFRCLPRWLKP
ncbi:hypothetical protein Tco_1464832 [Tanacetum coccineum]